MVVAELGPVSPEILPDKFLHELHAPVWFGDGKYVPFSHIWIHALLSSLI
jgi:hypothetical protein